MALPPTLGPILTSYMEPLPAKPGKARSRRRLRAWLAAVPRPALRRPRHATQA